MMEDRRGEMETRCRTDGLDLLAPAFRSRSSEDGGKLFFFATRDSDEDQRTAYRRGSTRLYRKKTSRLGISLDSVPVLKKLSEGWDPRGPRQRLNCFSNPTVATFGVFFFIQSRQAEKSGANSGVLLSLSERAATGLRRGN